MNPEIPIYVINLDEDTARLEQITTRLNALNLSFRRFPAYRGRNIPARWRQEFFVRRSSGSLECSLADGEIGCYASHLGCAAEFLETGANAAIILEDDLQFQDDLRRVPEIIGGINEDWDILRLVRPPKNAYVVVSQPQRSLELIRYSRLPGGVEAYCISRRGALKFIAHRGPRVVPLDIDMRYAYVRGLVNYGLLPAPARLGGGHKSSLTRLGRKRYRIRAARLHKRPLTVHRRVVFNIRSLSLSKWFWCLLRNIFLHFRRRLGLAAPDGLKRLDARP